MKVYKIIFFICTLSIPLLSQNAKEISEKIIHYDSVHFHIRRGYYTSGHLFYESYLDTIKKLNHTKSYYPNGELEEEGDWDAVGNFHVGIWKYYSRNGKFRNVSFDSTSQISYYKAIQIAKSYGFNKLKIEITEKLIETEYYWEIVQWEDKLCYPCNGEYILIRRSNGKVTKPKNNKLEKYE